MTGEPPAERLARERPLLVPLPRVRTTPPIVSRAGSGGCAGRVGRRPLLCPTVVAGELVEVRVEVATAHLEIRAGGQAVARHLLAAPGQA